MTDDTPVPPKRSRKKAAKAVDPGLVAVMADPGPPESLASGSPAVPELPAVPEAPEAVGVPPPAVEPAPSSGSDAPTDDRPTLRVERGGIGEATAGNVEVSVGGIGALTAEDVFVQWGGVGAARSEHLSVEFGSVGAVLAGEARITQGFATAIAARDATIEQALVRTLIAQRVSVNRPTGVLVMIAQHVSGDVRPLIDWRGALAAGLAFGLVAAVARAIRREG